MSGAKTPPVIAHRKGFYYEVKAGKRYLWCSCGRSKTQPFCDGSHAGSEFLPVAFKAEQDEDVIFCGCKHTGTGPFCDGAHSNLPGGYLTDDPDSAENRKVRAVTASAGPIVQLDGQCYVFSTSRAALIPRGALRYCAVVSPAQGALFQSQFYAQLAEGASPVISADARHTVLFVTEGGGEIEISGRRFTVFEAQYPHREATIDPSQRHKMAERYYQMLINREHGSTVVTQFIGNIPLSKAEPHRHLYEEALIFLNGAGVVWTERTKTGVAAGDVLFLPRKQLHSVQCTTPGGFDIVGVIYPGDNPSINY
jgi:CDGSH-type Zn-finger protein/quercetin dioxygenase-like cupin family protein